MKTSLSSWKEKPWRVSIPQKNITCDFFIVKHSSDRLQRLLQGQTAMSWKKPNPMRLITENGNKHIWTLHLTSLDLSFGNLGKCNSLLQLYLKSVCNYRLHVNCVTAYVNIFTKKSKLHRFNSPPDVDGSSIGQK